MGMSIDKAIKQLETYTIPCGKYKEAYDLAIETMRKYQKIEQIIQDTSTMAGSNDYAIAFIDIKRVIEDGRECKKEIRNIK